MYLDPDQVKAVVAAHDPALPRVVSGVGDYVLVMVRDDDLSLIPALLTKVCDCVLKDGFCIEAVMSSLVFAGPYPNANPTEAQRLELIEHLHQSMPGDVKIAHGRRGSLRGTLGSDQRFTWGSCLPSFSKSVAALERAKFGEVIELS